MGQIVTSAALDANRTAGSKDIAPDDSTLLQIRQAGKDKVMAAYRLCVTQDGDIATVTLLKSTGFTTFDAKIENTIRNKWRYRPFLVNGKRTPVCSSFGFTYWPRVL
jgi:hypothetical protein